MIEVSYNMQNTKHIFDKYKHKAFDLKSKKYKKYQYEYWIKTPYGFRSDDSMNHKYGDDRSGYEKWKNDNSDLVACVEQTTLRPIRKRKDYDIIVGYITETKLEDNGWESEITQLIDDCFGELCEELEVVDVETFKYFVFSETHGYENIDAELNIKLNAMFTVYDDYHADQEFKKLVDKIKG